MKMPKIKSQLLLSVIIPAYRAGSTLPALLSSLEKSTYKRFEVIIGDDASHETYGYKQLVGKAAPYAYTIVRLTQNRGPAAARNAAAKKAHGSVLVFLDSDVEVYPDTLENIAKKFVADADLTALTGVWDKDQKSGAFFPQFKALRDWSYWTNERDSDGYYYLFSTRIAAVKRDVFVRLGGFNTVFRQMEDVEITYRIARRYAIIFAPDVRVHHEFEGFVMVAKKYFWRSFYWTRLYSQRKKFDPVATTMWESIAAVSGVGAVGCMGLGFFVAGVHELLGLNIIAFSWLTAVSFQMAAVLFLLHIFLLRRFLAFVYHEKGLWFMVKGLFTGLGLYIAIVSGGLYFHLHHPSR